MVAPPPEKPLNHDNLSEHLFIKTTMFEEFHEY